MASLFSTGGLNLGSTDQVLGALLLAFDSSGNAMAQVMSSSGDLSYQATSSQGPLMKLSPGSTFAQFGTLALFSGSITDSSGLIDFGDEDLTTTGEVGIGQAVSAGKSLAVNGRSVFTANGNSFEVVQQNDGFAAFTINVDGTAVTAPMMSLDFRADQPNDRVTAYITAIDNGATKFNLWSDGGAAFTGLVEGTSATFSTTLEVTGTSAFTGNVGIGTAASGQTLAVSDTTSGEFAVDFTHTHATLPFGMRVVFSGGAPNDATQEFYRAQDSSATRFVVRSNGGIANFQSNDADLSDAREKIMSHGGAMLDGARATTAILGLHIGMGRYVDNMDSRDMVMITAQQAATCEDGWCAHDGWEMKDGTKRHGTYMKDIGLTHIRATQHLAAIIYSLREENVSLTGRVAELERQAA